MIDEYTRDIKIRVAIYDGKIRDFNTDLNSLDESMKDLSNILRMKYGIPVDIAVRKRKNRKHRRRDR